MRGHLVYCEQCGAAGPPGKEAFLIFHHLTFCCVECREDYRVQDEARAEAKRAAATLATVAEVMRRDKAAARRPAAKRTRAA